MDVFIVGAYCRRAVPFMPTTVEQIDTATFYRSLVQSASLPLPTDRISLQLYIRIAILETVRESLQE